MGQYRHFHSAAPPKTHRLETSGPMAYVCCFRGQHAGWIGSGHRKAVETVSPAAEVTPASGLPHRDGCGQKQGCGRVRRALSWLVDPRLRCHGAPAIVNVQGVLAAFHLAGLAHWKSNLRGSSPQGGLEK